MREYIKNISEYEEGCIESTLEILKWDSKNGLESCIWGFLCETYLDSAEAETCAELTLRLNRIRYCHDTDKGWDYFHTKDIRDEVRMILEEQHRIGMNYLRKNPNFPREYELDLETVYRMLMHRVRMYFTEKIYEMKLNVKAPMG